ncbi:MAG: hypothetical protein AAI946_00905 [Candidatus Hodgkinia cicadicola]
MLKYVEFALSALSTANAIGYSDSSIRFVKLALCALISNTVCDVLCQRALAWAQTSAYIALTLACAYSVGICWNWVGLTVHSGLVIHSVFVRALRTMACIRLAIRTLQAYGPSFNAAALSAFCGACGILTKAAILDELESAHCESAVGLIWVSLLVCVVYALGAPAEASYAFALAQALFALISWARLTSKLTQCVRRWMANAFRIKRLYSNWS